MNSIDKLIQIFSKFPGIGPRQARRFVYYLLTRTDSTLMELAGYISDLKKEVIVCTECRRFYEKKNGKISLCNICADPDRDHTILMLVQRDIDLEAIEKNGSFKGVYFVLGGSLPILEKEPEKRIRIKELKNLIIKRQAGDKGEKLREIIIAVNWNPEGENTGDYVATCLKPITSEIKISRLGKGLSMGTELEYTDPDTFKNALRNRG